MKKFMSKKDLVEAKKSEAEFNARMKRLGKKNVSYDISRPSCGCCFIFVEKKAK